MTRSTHQVLAIVAIAAASLLSAGASLAQEATADISLPSAAGSNSRASVVSELDAARQSGLMQAWSDGYLAPSPNQRQRVDVRAQTLRAKASGELKAINAQAYDFKPKATLLLSPSVL